MSFACVLHLIMSSCALHHHVSKTCIYPGLLVLFVVRSEPRHTCTRPWHVRNIILQVAGKCSRNGLKVGVQSYYSVDSPPAKFHRIRSSFDSPTLNYSGIIVRHTSDVFGLRKQSPGLSLFSSLSSRPSTQSTTHRQAQPNLSRQPADLLARASESCPRPDPGSRHRCVRIIPKHLQNVSVLLIGLPNIFFRDRPIPIEGTKCPYQKFTYYI